MAKVPQNPYSGLNPQSQLSAWNRFTDWLGITNNAGRSQYAHDVNSQMWQSEFDASMADRDYNSEQSTAERMRQAGINPNMQSVQGGQSSLSGNSANTPLSQPDLSATSFENFISTAFNTAMSIASGAVGISSALYNLDMQDMPDDLNSIRSFLLGHQLHGTGLDDSSRNNILGILLNDYNNPAFTSAIKQLEGFVPQYRTSRARNRAIQRLENMIQSDEFRTAMVESATRREDARGGLARSAGQNNALVSQGDIVDVTTALSNAEFELWKARNRYDSTYLKNENAFQDAISDPDIVKYRSGAYKNDLRETMESLETRLALKSIERDLIKKLAKYAKQGNILASGVLVGVSQLQNFDISYQNSNTYNAQAGGYVNNTNFGFSK